MKKRPTETPPPKSASANRFDKIFKENLRAVTPMLICHILKIDATNIVEVHIDVQHTKERKADFVMKITDSSGETFILQLEFQVRKDGAMVFRMAEYCIMFARKYKLPVRQFVIFLGKKKPKMATVLDMENLTFRYELITLAEIDYTFFLQSDKPEEVLFAILGNFKKQNPEEAVRQIIRRVIATSKGELTREKMLYQLRVLSDLRKLRPIIEKGMTEVSKYFKKERDFLYQEGMSVGEIKERERSYGFLSSLY